MTVSGTSSRNDYTAGGASCTFAYVFPITADTSLAVYVCNTLVTNYTVSGAGSAAGGTVTFAAVPAANSAVTLLRNEAFTQALDLVEHGPLSADAVETEFDKTAMLDQQLLEKISRAPAFAPFACDRNIIVESVVGQAGKILVVSSDETHLSWSTSTCSTSAATGTYTATGTGATARTITAKLGDIVSVKDFGAVGNGTTNDTAALQAAITAGVANNAAVFFPAGTYLVSAGTPLTDEAGTNNAALVMASNMHLYAVPGSATIKLAANQSTDLAPKRCALFFSNSTLTNLSFDGLIMDLNGANNPISPSRPASYNQYTFAHIIFSGTSGGVAAKADDVRIERCQFLNGPGASSIVCMQSNTASVTLGKRWTIRDNLFKNNGLDTDDHTSVYGWSDDVLVAHNTFTADTMWGTTGSTGGLVAIEMHGARGRVHGNQVRNYYQGCWLSGNYTSAAAHTVFSDNVFSPIKGIGIDTFRTSATMQDIHDVVIAGNTFEFDANSIAASLKAGVQIATVYAVSNILISGNRVAGSGATTAGVAVNLTTTGTVAAQTNDRIHIVGNHGCGLTFGVFMATSNTNALGAITIEDNVFTNLVATGVFASPMGVINNTGGSQPITYLGITGNHFLDTRTPPATSFGIFLSGAGGITTLNVGANAYSRVGTDYSEAGLGTVTTRLPVKIKGNGFQVYPTAMASQPTAASTCDGLLSVDTALHGACGRFFFYTTAGRFYVNGTSF